MNAFEFSAPGRVVCGLGSLERLGELAASLGKRPLVVYAASTEAPQLLPPRLQPAGLQAHYLQVDGEPSLAAIERGVQFSRDQACDCAISLGGGSAIDTAKAICGLHPNPGQPLDYLEVVGQGKSLGQPGLPHLAIPTTAGTGAEATRNAVIGLPEQGLKVSLRSPYLLPAIALLDPQLSLSLPPRQTADSGLDALTQLVEAFVSNRANPFSDAVCRAGLCLASRSLRRVYHHGDDLEGRQEMLLAAHFSGLALASARLGLVHGFAGVLGGSFGAPHGAICAALLPFVMQANIRALRAAQNGEPFLERYAEVASLLSGQAGAAPEAGVEWVSRLCAELGVQPLAPFGVSTADFPPIVEKARRASSAQGNPLVLPPEQLCWILQQAL